MLTIDDYLATSFEDGDLECIDGELQKNNIGEIDHSEVKGLVSYRSEPAFHPRATGCRMLLSCSD